GILRAVRLDAAGFREAKGRTRLPRGRPAVHRAVLLSPGRAGNHIESPAGVPPLPDLLHGGRAAAYDDASPRMDPAALPPRRPPAVLRLPAIRRRGDARDQPGAGDRTGHPARGRDARSRTASGGTAGAAGPARPPRVDDWPVRPALAGPGARCARLARRRRRDPGAWRSRAPVLPRPPRSGNG